MGNRIRAGILAIFIGYSAAAVHSAEPDAEGWIAFNGQGGAVSFDGSVNGQTARIILDSGSNVGAISRAFGERAGIEGDPRRPMQLSGVFGETRVYGSRPFELLLNDQTLNLADLAVVPRAGFDILLGRWIFEQVVVQIDYPNQRIRFLNRDAVEFDSNVDVRSTRGGALLIETFVQEKRAWLMLDTGNMGPVFLNERFVRNHDLFDFEVPMDGLLSSGVIQAGEIRMLQFDKAEIGPYRFDSLLANYALDASEGMERLEAKTGTRIRRPRTRSDGLLGFEVLRNFLVTTDFKNRKVHLHLSQN